MSNRATTCVWERSKAKGGSLLVLLAIADYAKDDGRWAWPSTFTLAWKSRLTFRQVRTILASLQEAQEIQIEFSAQENRRYLHVRCVFEEWPPVAKPAKEWNARDGEKTSAPRKKSPRGLTPSFPDTGSNLRETTADFRDPRKPTSGDPLSDPSSEEEHAAPSSPPLLKPVDAVENPINFGLLLKFAHEVLDGSHSIGDSEIERDVEQLCIDRRVPWDRETVRRAVRSAQGARRRHGATP